MSRGSLAAKRGSAKQKKPELLSCPFCGGNRIANSGGIGHTEYVQKLCMDCEARGPTVEVRYAGERIHCVAASADMWDRRVGPRSLR